MHPPPLFSHCTFCNNQRTLLRHEQYSQNDIVQSQLNAQNLHGLKNSTFC
nr:MAG TPA: hypothetical protein [Caudoviricetes sp.]